mmetsp:Transcript_19069/g.26059  ORF Transcript_19069/g.26059 Transcript_19069/m.26059 type:complete len:94 (-) Transcript_19069:89-370(-)
MNMRIMKEVYSLSIEWCPLENQADSGTNGDSFGFYVSSRMTGDGWQSIVCHHSIALLVPHLHQVISSGWKNIQWKCHQRQYYPLNTAYSNVSV